MLASIDSSKFSSNLSNTNVLCLSLSVPNRSRCALTLQMSSLPRTQFVILCSAPALPFVDLRVSVCHRNSCLWKVYGYCNRAVIIDNKKSENMQFISIFKLIKILLSIYFTTRLPRKKKMIQCLLLYTFGQDPWYFVHFYHIEATISGKLGWSGSGTKGQLCYIIRISYRR